MERDAARSEDSGPRQYIVHPVSGLAEHPDELKIPPVRLSLRNFEVGQKPVKLGDRERFELAADGLPDPLYELAGELDARNLSVGRLVRRDAHEGSDAITE